MFRLACAVLLLLGATGCALEKRRPNVLILMVDALRADHLGSYGYARKTSPRIDELAAESVLFANAYAQSPWTKPSIPTLFTSLYAMQHGVYEGEKRARPGFYESDVLSTQFVTLAESLRDRGYQTAAFVNNAHLPREHGMAQGFEIYEQDNLDAANLNHRFLRFLSERGDGPFFVYLHYLDVHWPFRPSAPFDTQFSEVSQSEDATPTAIERDGWNGLRRRINDGVITLSPADRERLVALHDGAIAEFDQQLGVLLDLLRSTDVLDDTVVVLTSDHGEELLDHGKVGHGGTLHGEVLRIPLMIRLPAGRDARIVQEPARLLDVYPTVLGLAGPLRDTPIPDLEGRDLLGDTPPPEVIIAETRHKRKYRVSVQKGSWKYVRTYRAKKAKAADAGAGGIATGMRAKASGKFTPEGNFAARKLRLAPSGDDDLEVSGPVTNHDPESREFDVHGYHVVAGEDLLGPEGAAFLARVRDGAWVKVEGTLGDAPQLFADEIEFLHGDDQKIELEGVVLEHSVLDDDTQALRIGGVTVLVSKETRIKRPALTVAAPSAPAELEKTPPVGTGPDAEAEAEKADRFGPRHLLAENGLEVEEHLFHLAVDPAELRDVTASQPERAAELHGEIRTWLERMAQDGRLVRQAKAPLDPESVNQLEALGYVE